MPVIVKLVVSFLLSGTVVVDISLSGLFDKLLSSGRSMHTVYLTDHGDIISYNAAATPTLKSDTVRVNIQY